MSFNKAKAQKSASKYVQQGKYHAAIDEYKKILQAEPTDVTTLNTLGDLYVKTGNNQEAIRSFLLIAEHYRAGSFNLKAIAMLKKVSKLDPDNVEIALKLAGLYAQQKLIVDARQQYLSVAESYLRSGNHKQALDIYQKISSLDPENTAIQLRLAEAYLRENQTGQAFDTFVATATELQRQNKSDEALQTYLRALEIKPGGQPALNSVVNLYIQHNQTEEAVGLITMVRQSRPDDADLLMMLGRIHQSAGNLSDAENAIAQAVEIDPNRFQYLLDLAHIGLRSNDFDFALRQVDRVIEKLHERREEDKAVTLLHEILTKDPNNFATLERLAAIYTRIREDHNLIETLSTLADAAIRKGEDEIAINALARLNNLEPDEIKHRRRLRSLGLSDDEIQQLSDSLLRADSRLETLSPRIPVVTATIQDSAESSTTSVQSVEALSGGTWGEVDAQPAPASSARTSARPENTWGEISPSENAGESFSFGKDEMVDVADSDSHSSGSAAKVADQYSDINLSVETEFDLSSELESEIITSSSESFFDNYLGETAPVTSAESGAPPQTVTVETDEEQVSANGLRLSEELSGVEFYISQGMLDVAQHSLEMLENNFPGNPRVCALRDKLNKMPDNATNSRLTAENGHSESGGFDSLNHYSNGTSALPVNSSASSTHTLSECALSKSSEEESREIVIIASESASATRPLSTASVPGMPANASASGSFDVGEGSAFEDLLDDLGAVSFDEGTGVTTRNTPATSHGFTAPASDVPAISSPMSDLMEMFDDFKQGSEQPNSGTEDFDTHYNLGLAYKDMEMYDDAVEEFQQAFKAVSSNPAAADVSQNQLLCCSMLGFCFAQKNMPRPAVMWYRKGLDVQGRTEDEYQALRYDLASAYESLGDFQSSYELFSEVYAVDINYRGVSERISKVQSRLNGTA
jgi:tetratricopeptide (TPR) repeat protein